jgi:hypothetical protein
MVSPESDYVVDTAKLWEYISNWRGIADMSENKHFRDITPKFFDSVKEQVKVRALKTFEANAVKKKARSAKAAQKKWEELAIAKSQANNKENDEGLAPQSVAEWSMPMVDSIHMEMVQAIADPGTNSKEPKPHRHAQSLARMDALIKRQRAMNQSLSESLATSNNERVRMRQVSDQLHEQLARGNAEFESVLLEEAEDTAIAGAPPGATCLICPGGKPMVRWVHDTTKGSNFTNCVECNGEFGQGDYVFSCDEPTQQVGGCGHSLCSKCYTATCEAVACELDEGCHGENDESKSNSDEESDEEREDTNLCNAEESHEESDEALDWRSAQARVARRVAREEGREAVNDEEQRCCPRGHPMRKAQAKDVRGKGNCDDCGASVQLEDCIEFCVVMSDQHESLDCNWYRCEACIQSLDEVEESSSRSCHLEVQLEELSPGTITDVEGTVHGVPSASRLGRNRKLFENAPGRKKPCVRCNFPCANRALQCADKGRCKYVMIKKRRYTHSAAYSAAYQKKVPLSAAKKELIAAARIRLKEDYDEAVNAKELYEAYEKESPVVDARDQVLTLVFCCTCELSRLWTGCCYVPRAQP